MPSWSNLVLPGLGLGFTPTPNPKPLLLLPDMTEFNLAFIAVNSPILLNSTRLTSLLGCGVEVGGGWASWLHNCGNAQ